MTGSKRRLGRTGFPLRSDGGAPNEEDDWHRREENPQGLLYFTRYRSVPVMVEALFDAPTTREFTYQELADKSDISPRSVRDRAEVLFDLGIIEEIPGTDRFTINLDSKIAWYLRELDGLIKQAQSGNPPTIDGIESDEVEFSPNQFEDEVGNSIAVVETVRNQATAQSHAD